MQVMKAANQVSISARESLMSDWQEFDTKPARAWERGPFAAVMTAYEGVWLLVAWVFGSDNVVGGYALFCAVVPLCAMTCYWILGRAFRDFRPDLDRRARRWYGRIALAVAAFAVAQCYGLWMLMARFV